MLGRAQTPTNNALVVQMAPCHSHRAAMGQGLDNLPFSLEKALQAANTCCGRLQKTQCGGLPLPFTPSLLAWRSCSALSWHFILQEEKQRVGSSQPEGAQLAGCLALQSGLFLAFHLLPAFTSIPNPLQPLAQHPVVLPSMS